VPGASFRQPVFGTPRPVERVAAHFVSSCKKHLSSFPEVPIRDALMAMKSVSFDQVMEFVCMTHELTFEPKKVAGVVPL